MTGKRRTAVELLVVSTASGTFSRYWEAGTIIDRPKASIVEDEPVTAGSSVLICRKMAKEFICYYWLQMAG